MTIFVLVDYQLIFLTILLAQQAHANCFLPNGTDRNAVYFWDNPEYNGDASPYNECNNETADFSMCCASWDQCRSDGLCFNQEGLIWRESCSMVNLSYHRNRRLMLLQPTRFGKALSVCDYV